MKRYAINYGRPVCPACGSRMLTHVEVIDQIWRAGCTSCKREVSADELFRIEYGNDKEEVANNKN
jgi:ribosomal protein L37AE/L43A